MAGLALIGRKGRAVASGILCYVIWTVLVILMLEIVGRFLGSGNQSALLGAVISLSVLIFPGIAALFSGVAHTFLSSDLPKPDILNRMVEALLFSLTFIVATFAVRLLLASGQAQQGVLSESDVVAAIGTGIYSLFFFLAGGFFTEGMLARKRHNTPEAF